MEVVSFLLTLAKAIVVGLIIETPAWLLFILVAAIAAPVAIGLARKFSTTEQNTTAKQP